MTKASATPLPNADFTDSVKDHISSQRVDGSTLPTVNPYEAPAWADRPFTEDDAIQRVFQPGLGIACVAALGIAISGFVVVMTIISVAAEPALLRNNGYFLGMIPYVLSVAVEVLTLVGGIQMMRLRMYPLAFTAAILRLIPCCSCASPLGVVVGVWAIVALSDKQVRAHFK